MSNEIKQHTLDTILSKSFSDYTLNKASDTEINTLVKASKVILDSAYLDFLRSINGFGLGGLNFYGTREQPEVYVLDVLKQNTFWTEEISALKEYFIIADGDMEFYCFDPFEKTYCALTKGTLTKVETYKDFYTLMESLLKIY